MPAETDQQNEMVSQAIAIAAEEEPAGSIGQYQIVRQIGEGAAGIVFEGKPRESESEAESVALKVIKEGEPWKDIVARFGAERQALVRVDHPHIAKFFDSGTRPSGQPYFVLELAEGLPMTRYCDEHKLSLPGRLELFVTVCQAVHHAHQKGLIHGDLKPSNIVVAGGSEEPAPKILDLGIAKATRGAAGEQDRSLDPTIQNSKPEYLSPEQAEVDTPDIDTRSDVYSLGVLLYELLTGTTPLTLEDVKDVSTAETLRLVRENDFSSPSERLKESQDHLSLMARRLRTKPKKLLDAVRGELDCVVKKSLEKDRDKRYETVHGLSADVERYLAGDQLEACLPSNRQMWKWAKKAPRPFLTATVAILLTLGFLVGTVLGIWEWCQASKAETEAREANQKREQAEKHGQELATKLHKTREAAEIRKKERDQAREAEKAAQKAENEVKNVLDFLSKQLMSAARPGDKSLPDAFWTGTRTQADAVLRQDMTLREAVDETESKVAKRFVNQPLEESTVREMLGLAYLNLGDAAKAVDQFQRAFELRAALQGVDNQDTADCRNRLAIAYRLAGRADDAARLFHRDPQSKASATALAAHGFMLLLEKKPAEAELKLRESLAIRQETQPDDWTTFETESLLGVSLVEQAKYDAAEPLLLSGYEGMKQHDDEMGSEDKGRLLAALERLVHLYEAWGKPDTAARWRSELWAARAPARN